MKLPLTHSLLAALPMVAASSTPASATQDRATGRTHLGGVPVHLRPATRQVLTVNRTAGWHAKVVWWEREGGRWHRELAARDGRTGDDYWVPDNASDHDNRYRDKRQGGFRWRLGPSSPNASERPRDFPRQHEWAITTGFNRRQVRHRGGAIFVAVGR